MQGHTVVIGAAERGHMDGDQATEAECSLADEVGVADDEHAMGQGCE